MQSISLTSRSQILKANAASPTGDLFCFFLLCTEVAALASTDDAVPLCTPTEAESSATGGINGFFFQCEIKFRSKSCSSKAIKRILSRLTSTGYKVTGWFLLCWTTSFLGCFGVCRSIFGFVFWAHWPSPLWLCSFLDISSLPFLAGLLWRLITIICFSLWFGNIWFTKPFILRSPRSSRAVCEEKWTGGRSLYFLSKRWNGHPCWYQRE